MYPQTRTKTTLLAESPEPPEKTWTTAWMSRGERLLNLARSFENAGPEGCVTLLVRIRESRPAAEEAPDPQLRALATCFLDELWETARRLLYGDLAPARIHAATARQQLETIRKHPRDLPR